MGFMDVNIKYLKDEDGNTISPAVDWKSVYVSETDNTTLYDLLNDLEELLKEV